MESMNSIIFAVALIGYGVIFLLVLIKSFKEGGVLTGVLGLVTVSIYTFVWGWMKSKSLQLTKTMLVWTLMALIAGALPFVFGTQQLLAGIPYGEMIGLQGPSKKAAAQKNFSKLPPQLARKSKAAQGKQAASGNTNADWNTKAVDMWRNGKYSNPRQALKYLNTAIKQNPEQSEAYNNRGNAYRNLKNNRKAMQDYARAIKLDPKFYQAYNNRGNVYFDQRNYRKAIADYNQSISLNPSYKLAYLNRGLAFHQLKNKDLACKDFQKACQLGDCDGLNWAKANGVCR
jgi:tetratricopeptide (TPR) repeat protein